MGPHPSHADPVACLLFEGVLSQLDELKEGACQRGWSRRHPYVLLFLLRHRLCPSASSRGRATEGEAKASYCYHYYACEPDWSGSGPGPRPDRPATPRLTLSTLHTTCPTLHAFSQIRAPQSWPRKVTVLGQPSYWPRLSSMYKRASTSTHRCPRAPSLGLGCAVVKFICGPKDPPSSVKAHHLHTRPAPLPPRALQPGRA